MWRKFYEHSRQESHYKPEEIKGAYVLKVMFWSDLTVSELRDLQIGARHASDWMSANTVCELRHQHI